MKSNEQLRKEIKENTYTVRWLMVSFLIFISAMALWDLVISGIGGLAIFLLMTSLITSKHQKEIILEIRALRGEKDGNS